ncbi:hypothetical protein FRB99_006555 [Tulasnella sp. 403]|nr:hypothetical protein FRB99_006555 [Tulasnella sp. 403]
MDSHLMPPSHRAPRKSPSHQSISSRRSVASLRNPEPGDNGTSHRVSLAHELAAALMPEPNLTSQMLAEEFGIEFEDGADPTDDGDAVDDSDAFVVRQHTDDDESNSPYGASTSITTSSFESVSSAPRRPNGTQTQKPSSPTGNLADEFETTFGLATPEATEDPLQLLAQNLQATDDFISQLRRVDIESQAASSHEPALERLAASVIGRLNDITREREDQVRVLMEYDRELRQISGEVGGNDVLGSLDEMEYYELLDPSERVKEAVAEDEILRTPTVSRRREPALQPETPSMRTQARRSLGQIHEDDDQLYDANQDDAFEYDVPSPGRFRRSFDLPPPPPPPKVVTASSTLPHLSHFRTLTQSLIHSLTSLSEHAQVNGVNTAEAGRKLRALKNKVQELKTDWDSAEKSRIKIQRWQAGLIDDLTAVDEEEESASPGLSFSGPSSRETSPGPQTPEMTSGPHMTTTRVDGRAIVAEQLRGFELALAEAAEKTQAIMSR